MATPPTFVAEYESVWNTTATKSVSVTVAAGDTLVVFGVTEDSQYTLNTPTGGSLTYTLQQSIVVSSYTSAYLWTAPCPSSQSFTLQVTVSTPGNFGINVARFSGSNGIGASSKTNSTGGAPSLGLTTTGDNSAIVAVVGDWNAIDGSSRTWRTINGITPTSGNGLELTYSRQVGLYVAYGAYWNDAGTAGSKTAGISSPSGQAYAIAAVEVLGVSASAPAFPPSQQVRRRLSAAPRLPLGRSRTATPVRAQVNPPFPFTGVKQPRLLRGLAPRRGEAWAPVPPQVVVAAAARVPLPVRERLKGLRLFRPEAFTAATTQSAPPQNPSRFRLRGLRIHGSTTGPVPPQVVVTAPAWPPQSLRTRLRGLRLFRPRPATPVPAQIVVTPPAYPPANVRTRLRGAHLARGAAVTPVPGQVFIAAPPYVPLPVRARIKALRLFRARPATTAPGQAQPPATRVPRVRPPAPARGQAVTPVAPQVVVAPPAYPPRPVRPRLKGLRGHRGRQAAMPVPPQIVIVPPKFPPAFARIKQHAVRLFRGQWRTPVAPVCDCQTHRPNLGVTARPGTGTTSRPDSGTTARPCACSGGE